MADDILAQLGLDARSFKTEVNAVNAHLKSLENEEKSVNAQIAILEKNMRLAGKSTGAQVAQLGQLRVALRAIKGDMAEVARGQKSLNAIGSNGSGGGGGPIGGDSSEGGGSGIGGKALSGLSRGLGLGALGVAGAVAAGVIALKRLGSAILSFGDDAASVNRKLGGSQRGRDISSLSGNGAAYSSALGAMFTQFSEKLKAGVVGAFSEIAGKVFGVDKSRGDKIQSGQAEMLANENAVATAKYNQTSELKSQLAIMEAQSKELWTQLQFYSQEDSFDAEKLRSLGAQYGELQKSTIELQRQILLQEIGSRISTTAMAARISGQKTYADSLEKEASSIKEISDAMASGNAILIKNAVLRQGLARLETMIDRREELNTEREKTREMQLQHEGMSGIAAMVKTEADYNAKILKARQDNNSELAAQLALQKNIAMAEGRVGEHNMTTRQLLDERRGARKFARDDQHELARQADFADRQRRGAYGATAGSRASRWWRQEQGRRAAAQDQTMKVSLMNTAKMVVSQMTVNVP